MKSKIFFGRPSISADEQFNEWMDAHPTARITGFRYQQSSSTCHSICILYWELEEDGGLAS